MVYMVYYTGSYYFVDSVWDNRSDAEARAEELNEIRNLNYIDKSVVHFSVQKVTLNSPRGARG